MNIFTILLGGFNQGLIWGLLAIGVFLTFRILDFADLTVEGSFTCGGATAAALISNGVNPWLATLVAVLTGGAAGLVTALLNTKLKIPPILAGILTMIALYSINIAIMGGAANKSLYGLPSVFNDTNNLFGKFGMDYAVLILGLLVVGGMIAALYWYFGTESGSAVRATGDNPKMCRAQGINTDNTKIIGLVISNALVGLCGALIAQHQGYADVQMGVGAIVIGLASVIIGETILGKKRSFLFKLIAVVLGSVVYRIIITLCITFDILDASYLKLLTAVIVAVALSIPTIKVLCHKLSKRWQARHPKYAQWIELCEENKARREALRKERREERAQARLAAQTAREETMRMEQPEKWQARCDKLKQREEKQQAALLATEQRLADKKIRDEQKNAEAKKRVFEKETAHLQKLTNNKAKFEAKQATIAHPSPKALRRAQVYYDAVDRMIAEQQQVVDLLSAEQNGGETVNLKIVGLSKTFNTGTINQKRALSEINLEIKKGDFITVIGGNGAGKSTLLNMTSGVFEADAGSIYLDGINVTRMPEYSRAKYLGRVFQDPMMGTAANMEISENLGLAARRGKVKSLRWSVTKEEAETYAKQLKELDLGLETRLSSKVGLLSGGQRQALTLFMATLVEPKLLLLDEHTAALDPKTAKKVLNLTEKITSERNLTALMVTHNMNDALRLGNRLIMMHEGRIIYDVEGEEKKKLTVDDLLKKFESAAGEALSNDKMLLSN